MENFKFILERIGKNIRYYRLKKGMTQELLGERIGCSQSNVSLFEAGKKFNLETYYYISKEFKISLRELLFADHSNKDEQSYINKFKNNTYYCYYVANDEIKYFQMEIYDENPKGKSSVKICFKGSSKWIPGEIVFNDKFAVVFLEEKQYNKHYILVINYHHDSYSVYSAGIGFFQSVSSKDTLPKIRCCAISNKKIPIILYNELKNNFLCSHKSLIMNDFEVKVDTCIDEIFYTWHKNLHNT